MDSTNWLRQTPDKPLFPDLLWSRPENRRHAGKLLIAGGNAHNFAAVSAAYAAAEKAGIGTARVLVPSSLERMLSKIFPEAEFAPSTPSGSFSKASLAQLCDNATWSDGVLLAGDFGKNSETEILLINFLSKYQDVLALAGDSLDYFYNEPSLILDRPATVLIADFGQLQKLLSGRLLLKHSMNLAQIVEALVKFGTNCQASIVTSHSGQVIVAASGRISTTPLNIANQGSRLDGAQGDGEQRTEPYEKYGEGAAQPATQRSAKNTSGAAGSAGRQAGVTRDLELAAHVSVWRLQQPNQAVEALTCAVYCLLA